MATLEGLREIGDRLAAAQRALDDLRQERDDYAREVRRSTDQTVPEIAAAARVSLATAKTVIRGVRRGR